MTNSQVEIEKLVNAVFFRNRTHKNIFNVMQDEITELRAQEIQHEKTTTAQLESFNRTIQDMKRKLTSQQKFVDNFQDQLDKTRESTDNVKRGLEDLMKEM